MRRLILGILLLAVVGVAVYAAGMWFELYGAHRGPGAPEAPAVPDAVYQQRQRQQQRAASRLTPAPTKEILFGDLHVHGTEGVKFYTRTKVITERWPEQPGTTSLAMPTME